jgi:hypothetical protein
VRQIVPAITAFKLRYFAHEGINLHSRDIRKSEGPFKILQNLHVRQSFLSELSELIKTLPFTLFCTAIKKEGYKERYGDKARNPYDVGLEYSFERILHFLEFHQETKLPVIAEARGKQEDDELRASFYDLMTKGTHYNPGKRFRLLECPISFRKKSDNIAGVQLADLCAHPIAQHILQPSKPNRAFEIVQSHFYQNGSVQGLKIFPK